MCRYVYKSYKKHYGCFACRKVFRRPSPWQLMEQDDVASRYDQLYRAKKTAETSEELAQLEAKYYERVQVCPDCRGQMADLGMDFKAPKRSDVKEWKIVASMYRMGHRFQTCGCDGPGFIPSAPHEHKRYLEKIKGVYQRRLAEHQTSDEDTRWERVERSRYWSERIARVQRALDELH